MADPDKKSLRPAGGQKLHLVKSSTWNKIRKLLEMADLLPDPTQFETIERAGKKHFRLREQGSNEAGAGGGGPVGTGAFFTMRTVSSGGADNGDIYLQGGSVSGATGNEIVDEILLYDASTDTWEGTAGQHLQLQVTGNGHETSGILDPIFTVTATATSSVTTMTANTLPTSGSVSSKNCYISLGAFIEDGFTPAGAGNITVRFCWAGYVPSRS